MLRLKTQNLSVCVWYPTLSLANNLQLLTMKAAIIASIIGSAAAFAPSSTGKNIPFHLMV